MKEVFKAEQIAENVYWVGAVDWNVRNFHGYQTGRGSTYNAFLVIDEKVTLIDTVKAPFFGEMLARIRSVIDPEKIDYIISNHAEPDHSGAIVSAIEARCLSLRSGKRLCGLITERTSILRWSRPANP